MSDPINRRQLIASAMTLPLIGTTKEFELDDTHYADIDLLDEFLFDEIDPRQQRLLDVIATLVPETPSLDPYPRDPVAFIHDTLGMKLWQMQQDIVYSVFENRYTSVASCHAAGKSVLAAATVLAFLHHYEDSIVLTTAPTGRQVEHVLWRYIRTMHRKARKPLLGNKPLTTRYDISESWYAMGFKPTDSETDPVQGFHAHNILAIVDEAAGAPAPLIDGMQATMTSEGARMLFIGNPTSTSGPFFDSHHSKRHMYKWFVIAWPDTPNANKENPDDKDFEGLITQGFVDDAIEKYGEQSPYVRSRVYAEWVSADGVLIPLAYLEAAQKRDITHFVHPERMTEDTLTLAPIEAGLDVSRSGKDRSVLTIRMGPYILLQQRILGDDGPTVATAALKVIAEKASACKTIKVDVIGVGSSVVDQMRLILAKPPSELEMLRGLYVQEVNFSKTPWDEEKYANQRSEAYGLIASRFIQGDVGGKIEEECVADLSDIHLTFKGRFTQPVIESKEEFIKRTGKSPDYGDSLVLAFYQPPPDDPKPMGVLAFNYAKNKFGPRAA